MSWFRRNRDTGDEPFPLDVRLRIFESVWRRILRTLSSSRVEEGGKLLGRFGPAGGQLVVSVDTYIDSGPRLDHSSTHLHPDGVYQEAIFRVVESFDAAIEHIGSWHSHHCNGCPELSPGDIRGYLNSVNSEDYNLDYFYALLITGIRGTSLEARHFLFKRRCEEFWEIPAGSVEVVPGSAKVERLLLTAERMAMRHRGEQMTAATVSGSLSPLPAAQQDDRWRVIRSQDQHWISLNYPDAKSVRNRLNGAVGWRWTIREGGRAFDIRYNHPTQGNRPVTRPEAELSIEVEGRELFKGSLPIDAQRFDEIRHAIRRALMSIAESGESPSSGGTR